jgi:hypothetical protein
MVGDALLLLSRRRRMCKNVYFSRAAALVTPRKLRIVPDLSAQSRTSMCVAEDGGRCRCPPFGSPSSRTAAALQYVAGTRQVVEQICTPLVLRSEDVRTEDVCIGRLKLQTLTVPVDATLEP